MIKFYPDRSNSRFTHEITPKKALTYESVSVSVITKSLSFSAFIFPPTTSNIELRSINLEIYVNVKRDPSKWIVIIKRKGLEVIKINLPGAHFRPSTSAHSWWSVSRMFHVDHLFHCRTLF